MRQRRKLVGDQPLQRIAVQMQQAQAIVAVERLLVQRLDGVLAQIDLDQDLQVAERIATDVGDVRPLQIDALQIDQPEGGELLARQRRNVVAVQLQRLDVGVQRGRYASQLLVVAFDRLLAVGPLADAAGRAAGGPVIGANNGGQGAGGNKNWKRNNLEEIHTL